MPIVEQVEAMQTLDQARQDRRLWPVQRNRLGYDDVPRRGGATGAPKPASIQNPYCLLNRSSRGRSRLKRSYREQVPRWRTACSAWAC